jgi:tetratricopeptide (TPR) repeat protein
LSFFCRSDDPGLTKPSSILCNFLAQLTDDPKTSACHAAIIAEIEPVFDRYPNTSSVSVDLLWKTFMTVVPMIETLHILLDGLDECDPDEDLDFLVDQLQELGTTSGGRVKIIITSRTGYSDSCHHKDWITLQIRPGDVQEDILRVATDMIVAEPKFQGLRQQILDTVSKHAQGMFLWTKILLESLKITTTRKQMIRKLENPPIGLDKLYIDILSHMDEHLTLEQRLFRRNIFTWILGAMEPLKLDALSIALTMQVGEGILDQDDILIEPKNEIIRVCGPLVQFMEDEILRPVHFSFREFLKDSCWDKSWNVLSNTDALDSHITILNDDFMHETIAMTCLDHLSLDCFHEIWKHKNDPENWPTAYPLLPYAAENWWQHILKVTQPTNGFINVIIRFCDSLRIVDWVYILATGPKTSLEDVQDAEKDILSWMDKYKHLNNSEELSPEFVAKAHWNAINTLDNDENISVLFKIEPYVQLASCFMAQNRWTDGSKVAQTYVQSKEKSGASETLLSTSSEGALNTLHTLERKEQSTIANSLKWLESLFSEYLEIVKETYGDDHILTASAVVLLCRIYQSQGHMSKAHNTLTRVWDLSPDDHRFKSPELLSIWGPLATVYGFNQRDDQSLILGQQIWERMQSVYGRSDKDTLRFGWHLASSFLNTGDVESALPKMEIITKGFEETYGKENRETLACKMHLAKLYATIGRFAEAEPLYLVVFEAQKRTLGEYHRESIYTALSLASDYLHQNRVSDAEVLVTDLSSFMDQNDTTELSIAQDYQILISRLEMAKGNYKNIESSLEKSWEWFKTVCGESHPMTQSARWNLIEAKARDDSSQGTEEMTNDFIKSLEAANQRDLPFYTWAERLLARLYSDQDRFGEAEALLRQQLTRLQETRRTKKQLYATYSALSRLYQKQSRFEDAEQMILKASQQNSDESKYADNLLHELANIYESMERYEEAQDLLERLWIHHKEALGESHGSTVIIAYDLGRILELNGHFERSCDIWMQVWSCRDATRKVVQPTMKLTAQSLTNHYENQGQAEKALEIASQLWEYLTTRSNKDTLEKLRWAVRLGRTSQRVGLLDDAIKYLTLAFQGLQQEVGPDHVETLRAGGYLSQLLVEKGKFDDGIQLAKEILSLQESTLGRTNEETQRSYSDIAFWYTERELFDEAKGFRQTLLEAQRETLGEDHKDTLHSKLNLAFLHRQRPEDPQKTLELLESTCMDLKTHLGETHEDTLNVASAVADLLLSLRADAPKCLQYAKMAYEGSQSTRGPADELTLLYLSNLAQALSMSEMWEEAIDTLKEGIKLGKLHLAPYHEYTLRTSMSLALVYKERNRMNEAQELVKALCSFWRQASKSDIVNASSDVCCISTFLTDADDLDPAMDIFKTVLNAYVESTTVDRRIAWLGTQLLASSLVMNARWKEATELWLIVKSSEFGNTWIDAARETLKGMPQTDPKGLLSGLGDFFSAIALEANKDMLNFVNEIGGTSFSPAIRTSLGNLPGHEMQDLLPVTTRLAEALYQIQSFDDAELVHIQVYDASKKIHGENNNSTIVALRGVAKCFSAQKKWKESAMKNYELLEIRDQTPDTTERELLETLGELAVALVRQEKHAEAEPILQRFYELSLKVDGPNDPSTHAAAKLLLDSLILTVQWARLEESCQAMMEAEKNRVGSNSSYYLQLKSTLTLSYAATGRMDECAKACQEVLETARGIDPKELGCNLFPLWFIARAMMNDGNVDQGIDIMTAVLELSAPDGVQDNDLEQAKEEFEAVKKWRERKNLSLLQRMNPFDSSSILQSPITPIVLVTASILAVVYIRRMSRRT